MEKEICKDIFILGRHAVPAAPEDLPLGQDLLDTLKANRDRCVGMAANMIGEPKAIIAFDDNGALTVMFNPKIIKKDSPFETEEGCLSLQGTRKTTRYRSIKVEYRNEAFQKRIKTFKGFTAQIIQHECDHLEGILI